MSLFHDMDSEFKKNRDLVYDFESEIFYKVLLFAKFLNSCSFWGYIASLTDSSKCSLHSLPNPLPASLTDSGRPFHR
jgi:hypothetical protein